MAITYTWGNPTIRNSPREPSEAVTQGAQGVVPWSILSLIIAYNDDGSGMPGIVIEIREGAYTPQEWAAMEDTTDGVPQGSKELQNVDYNIKWRAWYGDPLPEQMARTPWGEAGE